MPERTCRTAFQYAGSDLAVGDRFNVEDQHVDLLLKTGHIEPVEGEYGYMKAANETREQRRKKRFG